MESLLPKDIPSEWALIDGPRFFTKKTLFQRINGQAELFFKYGFKKSIFAIYQDRKKPGNQIELDIYDMGNVLQAFGIFSRFRNEDRSMGIGLDSYLNDPSAFFYKDKYFVLLYTTESNPIHLKKLATRVSLRILSHSLPPKEIDYFPKNGLKLGSIQYFSEGLLGHQFLKRGFLGTYIEKVENKDKVEVEGKEKVNVKAKENDDVRTESKEFQLFLAIFANSQEAMGALRIYRDHLSKKGKIHSGRSTQFGLGVFRGEDPYKGQIIMMQKGPYLLGVLGFEREEEGESLLKELIKNVK